MGQRNALSLADLDRRSPADEAIAEHVTRLKQVMVKAVDEDAVRKMMESQVEKAKRGDQAAFKFILDVIGQVAEPPAVGSGKGRIRIINPRPPAGALSPKKNGDAVEPDDEDEEDNEDGE